MVSCEGFLGDDEIYLAARTVMTESNTVVVVEGRGGIEYVRGSCETVFG